MGRPTQLPVTKPFLPPFDQYVERLRGIWERNVLTNQGPLLCELEERLKLHLGASSDVCCVANGGLALQIALRALSIEGEVITTPFSYVATASCALWERCPVVFADIDPDHLTIDPESVAAAVGPRTEAILATHVFGNPCDVPALEAIARKHDLKIIYDAAHAFGVNYRGKSILDYGDVSMVSLHATKLLHSVEGGLLTAADPDVGERIEWMRRFGHDGPEAYQGVGINAKMSELHAAMGLCCLDCLDEILEDRRQIVEVYNRRLGGVGWLRFAFRVREGAEWNNAYYPVVCDTASRREELAAELLQHGFQTRRYFYPSLDEVFRNEAPGLEMPVSRDVADRILCLPLAAQMDRSIAEKVCAVCAGID